MLGKFDIPIDIKGYLRFIIPSGLSGDPRIRDSEKMQQKLVNPGAGSLSYRWLLVSDQRNTLW
jgi:hypothetical protein